MNAPAAPGAPAPPPGADVPVLADAADDPTTVVLETLTDEELAVLSVAESVVVTPYLSEVAPKERPALLRTAYRGLLARGIVDPPTPEARREAERAVQQARAEAELGDPEVATGDPVVQTPVRTDVMTTIALRQAAPAVVAVARTTAVTQDFVYVHVVDDILLLEEVTAQGLHRFALRERAGLVETVLGLALHPDTPETASDGTAVGFTAGPPGDPSPPDELLELAGAALLRCDVTVLTVHDDAPVLYGVFSAPTGCWLFESRRDAGEPVTARPVGRDDLRRLIATAVTDLPRVPA